MNKDAIHLKYLAVNKADLLWGLAVHSVGFQSIAPGEPYPPTGHPSRYLFSEERGRILQEYQLLYITEGRGYFRSAATGHKIPLSRGSMFLLFPGEWHTYCPDPATGWNEFWIGFDGALIDRWVENGFFSPERPVFSIGLHEDLVNLYQEAIQAATDQESGFQQRLLGIVNHLLGLSIYYERKETFSEVADLINRAKIYIAERPNAVSPEDVADYLCIGYSKFRKLFKEYTGFSPARYIQEVRLTKVKEALTNTNTPVKQIAWDMEFDNFDYFCTAFRRLTGMTPTQYRKMTQGQ